jgi:hypothetical protein
MSGRRTGRAGAADRNSARRAAEALAIQALQFLAADPERLGHFLALSGIGPEAIRAAAREPNFLAGVLEHILSDERLLLDFAKQAEIEPPTVMRAAATLGAPGWERDVP